MIDLDGVSWSGHMKMNKRAVALAAFSVAAGISARAYASDVYKADVADPLDTGPSWVLGVVPASTDVAVWSGNITNNLSSSFSTNLSWMGIRVGDAVSGSPTGTIVINGANSLTLGSAGIDLSLSSVSFTANAPIAFSAAQNWSVAAGKTIAATGTVSPSGFGFTSTGQGAIQINTYNSAGGAINTSAGSLAIANPLTLTSNLSVNASGAVTIAGTTANGSSLINKNGTATLTFSGGLSNFTSLAQVNVVQGGVVLGQTAGVTLSAGQSYSIATGASLLVNNIVTVSEPIIKNGGGQLQFGNGTSSVTNASNGITVNAGTLFLNGSVNVTNAYTLNGGTLSINGAANSDPLVANSTVTFNGGTLASAFPNGNTLSVANNLVVPAGQTGTFIAGARSTLGSGSVSYTLTGGGVFNYVGVQNVARDEVDLDFSAFTGTVNFTSATTALTQISLRVNGGKFVGFANAADINLDGAAALYLTTNSTGNTVAFNTLTGTSLSAILGGGTAGAATYNYTGNVSSDLSASLQGNSIFNKNGTGTLRLKGVNFTQTNNFNVNNGTVLFDGFRSSTATGNFNVNSGAIFGGTGTSTGGTLVVNNGGRVSPGDPGVGTLTMLNTTLTTGSMGTFEFNGTTNDILATTNTLTLGGTSLFLFNEGTTTPFSTNGTYNLFSYGSLTGATSQLTVNAASQVAGKKYTFAPANVGGVNYIQLSIGTNTTPTYWAVNGSGNWGASGNWTAGVPDYAGAAAGFGAPGTVQSGPATITLGANRTVGSLTFNDPQPFTIGAGAGNSLILDNAGAAGTISAINGSHTINAPLVLTNQGLSASVTNATDVLTLNGAITAASGATLGISGAGVVLINAPASYDGGTFITGGILRSGVNNALPATTALQVAATFDLNGHTQSVGSITGGGTVTNSGSADATLILPNAQTFNTYLADGPTNKVSLSYTGNGTLTLNAANQAFSGGLTTASGATVVITSNLGAGTGPIYLADQTTLSFPTTTSVFVNNNVTVAPSGTATLTAGAVASGIGGVFTLADANSVLQIGGSTQVSLSNNNNSFAGPGTVHVLGGSSIRFSSSTLANSGGAGELFILDGSIATRNNGTLHLGAVSGGGGISTGGAGTANTVLTVVIGEANLNASYDGVVNDVVTTTNPSNGINTNHYTAVTKAGSGTQTFTASQLYSGNTTVNGGELILNQPLRPTQITSGLGSANVSATGGTLLINAPGQGIGSISIPLQANTISLSGTGVISIAALDRTSNQQTVVMGNALNISGTSTLDLGTGDAIIHGGTATAIYAGLVAGAHLTSSASVSAPLTGTGFLLNTDEQGLGGALYTTFDGQTALPTDILFKYTYLGDTDLNGYVDGNDLANAIAGADGGLTLWKNGDFNYDGVVNGTDIGLLLNSLVNQGAPFGGGTGGSGSVPEPTMLAPLVAGLGLLTRRRR